MVTSYAAPTLIARGSTCLTRLPLLWLVPDSAPHVQQTVDMGRAISCAPQETAGHSRNIAFHVVCQSIEAPAADEGLDVCLFTRITSVT